MQKPSWWRTFRQDNQKTLWALGTFVLSTALPWAVVSCGSDATSSAANANATTVTTTTGANVVCDDQAIPSCPNGTVIPSWATTVESIVSTYCLECHDPNGVGTIATPDHPHPQGNPNFAGDANNPNMFGNPNDGNRIYSNDHNQWDTSTTRDWSDFNNIVKQRADIMKVISTCVMPAENAAAQPSMAARATLLQWLACGAPDN